MYHCAPRDLKISHAEVNDFLEQLYLTTSDRELEVANMPFSSWESSQEIMRIQALENYCISGALRDRDSFRQPSPFGTGLPK
jgi:hypothetical protein